MKITWFTCLVLLLVTGTSAIARADKIAWNTDLTEAKRQAGLSGRLVMLNIYAPWSEPCHMMDDDVYPDPLVVQTAAPFIAVRQNGEKAGARAVRDYNIHFYPTILFLDAYGEVFDKLVGGYSATDFAFALNSVKQECRDLSYTQNRVQQHPEDARMVTNLAIRLARAGRNEEVETLISALEDVVAAKTLGATYNALGTACLSSEDWKRALQWYGKTIVFCKEPHYLYKAHIGRYKVWARQGNSGKMAGELKETLALPKLTPSDRAQAQQLLDVLTQKRGTLAHPGVGQTVTA